MHKDNDIVFIHKALEIIEGMAYEVIDVWDPRMLQEAAEKIGTIAHIARGNCTSPHTEERAMIEKAYDKIKAILDQDCAPNLN